MNPAWQRVLLAVAGSAAAMLLTGCEVTGTVDVRSETEVVADLLITDAEVDCLGLDRFNGLVVKGSPDASGGQVCRAQGTLDLESFQEWGIRVNRVGEYLILDIGLPRRFGYGGFKLDVNFPGRIVDPGQAMASGNRVTIEAGTWLVAGEGGKVVGLAHPGPELWVLSVAGGLLGGVALTLGGTWLLRRQRRLATEADGLADPLPEAGAAGPQPSSSADAVAGTDAPQRLIPATSGRPPAAPDVGRLERDPDYGLAFAPPAGPQAPGAPQPAPPPDPPPVQPPEELADHRIWAPPEDAGADSRPAGGVRSGDG